MIMDPLRRKSGTLIYRSVPKAESSEMLYNALMSPSVHQMFFMSPRVLRMM